MPEDALHKSAAASNENRVTKAPSQDSGRSTDGRVAEESDAPASAQSSLKSESLTKTAFDGELLAGTTEVHSPSVIAASNGAQAVSSRLPADPWSGGYKPAPLPEELEPSRKIETPDMLRWRAEMLLDEMMVGAVDVSAGDGAGWRASAHNGASLPIDEHPRFEPRVTAQQAAPTPDAGQQITAVANEATAATNGAASGAAADVVTVDKAAVRAALPPRSTSRMPTPIGRNGEPVANGYAANGHSASGHSADGYSTNGHDASGHAPNGSTNGSSASNGNGNYDVTSSAPYSFVEIEIDPLVSDIADDGRPAPNQNGASNGSSDNGAAPRTPTRIDGSQETPAANRFTETPASESLIVDTNASTPDTTATGYALDSSPARPSRRTTTASMVDPLEELDANPPLPATQAWVGQRAPQSYTPTDNTPAPPAFTPAGPTAPELPRTPARTPTRSAAPAEDPYSTADAPASTTMSSPPVADGSQSLAAQYSAYAPPPSMTPAMPPRIEPKPAESSAGRAASKGKLTAVEQRYPRQIQPDPNARAAASTGTHNDSLPNEGTMQTGGLGPVRINPAVLNSASITGAMAVGSRASSRYASLLPRATPWDLHEMEREIVALQEEMARVMPQGHESTRRARHLLEKAQTIFVNDPLRSAEVDYYLTQVKAIVQRSHQTLEWSERYRRQLIRYHWAWIGFSALMLALCVLFGAQLQGWAVALFGINETGILARNLVPAAIAIFAGSLGASVGALITMRRYHSLALGYFDRKYSLRGLVLPVIGMLGGLVFYGLFATLYWAMGVRTPLPFVLELLPTALAFLLGFLQENLYGTRD